MPEPRVEPSIDEEGTMMATPGEHDAVGEAMIALSPAGPMGGVARLSASACGAIAGFSVDELADLRLLVDEVFDALLQVGTGPIELRLAPRNDRVELEMSARSRDERGWRLEEFEPISTLVSVLADEASFFERDGRLALRLAMSARFP